MDSAALIPINAVKITAGLATAARSQGVRKSAEPQSSGGDITVTRTRRLGTKKYN